MSKTPMKRTVKESKPKVPATVPNLTRAQQVELLAMFMYDKDAEAQKAKVEALRDKVLKAKEKLLPAWKKAAIAYVNEATAEDLGVCRGLARFTFGFPVPGIDKLEALQEEVSDESCYWGGGPGVYLNYEWHELRPGYKDVRSKYIDSAKAKLGMKPLDLTKVLKLPGVAETLGQVAELPDQESLVKLLNEG